MQHLAILTEPKGYSPKAIATLKKLGPVVTWQEAHAKPIVLKRATILVVKLGMKISKRVLWQPLQETKCRKLCFVVDKNGPKDKMFSEEKIKLYLQRH